MQRNIKLVKYKKYDDFILFEHVNAPKAKSIVYDEIKKNHGTDKSFREQYEGMNEKMKLTYETIRDYIISLGDDVSENELKYYMACKRVRHFVCLEIRQEKIFIRLKLDPDTVKLQKGFTRDMRNIGHYGTGDLEVTIKSIGDFENAKEFINRSYEENI